MLYLFGENNTVGLAEATPEGYAEKGRFTIEDQGRAIVGAPGGLPEASSTSAIRII